jgi:hypothetical protein
LSRGLAASKRRRREGGVAAALHNLEGEMFFFFRYCIFLNGLTRGPMSTSANSFCFCHLGAKKWVLPVSFGVNLLLTCHLLQKLPWGQVDLRYK